MTKKDYKRDKEINWCWWEGWIIKPPLHIFFETSCNKHDELYNKGWDWFDRWIADIYLLKYMWQDCNRLPRYKITYYHIWCFIYYVSVRIVWFKYFKYDKW